MDLIERDKALEIIEERRKRYKFEDWETADLEWISDEIWGLPSVREWIPCEDAISRQAVIDGFWGLECEIRPSCVNAMLDMINGLPSVPKAEWIPCSERLPEAEYVLAQYQDGVMAVLIGDRIPMWNIVNQPKPIVAWMPLPEPYKEKKE